MKAFEMTIFYTADPHFFHANIIKFSNRPFASVSHMNEALIANWNAVVKRGDDEVWVVGDFAMRANAAELLAVFNRLNGRKYLVIGNHDDSATLSLPWSAPPVPYAERSDAAFGQKVYVVLHHYPMRSWNGMYRGSYHLFGHDHGNIPDYNNACDVGVDRWNYTPMTFGDTYTRMANAGHNPDFLKSVR